MENETLAPALVATTGRLTMPAKVAAAVVAVAKKVKGLTREGENEHGRYRYTSVDQFYEALGPLMAEAGLFTLADLVESKTFDTETTDRYDKVKRTSYLHMAFDICLVHESGEMSMPVKREVTVINAGPQGYASAESFVTKYFIRNLFKVPTGDYDADEQAKTGDEEAEKPKAPTATPKQAAAAEAREEVTEAKRKVAIAFAEQVNQFLDTNPTPEALFTYEGDPKINPKMKRIRSDEWSSTPAIAATIKRMNEIYAGAPEREVGEDG